MKTDETIIRIAIGDPSFSLGRKPALTEVPPLRIYRIQLPDGYRHGFPPVWDFALVPERAKPRTEAERTAVLDAAQGLIDHLKRIEITHRLVIVSSDETIDLSAELPPDHPNVFYIGARELGSQARGLGLYFSPFMLAIRQKFTESEARARLMTPYIPGNPVTENWRFFGREKELERLVYSSQNFIVVGARRTGKTSLMIELNRRLRAAGATTYLVNVQDVDDESELVRRMLEELDPARAASLMRRKEIISESLLGPSLRAISGKENPVLLLDELGNILFKMRKEAWRVLGVIRNFAQSGNLRVIATSSQEFFLRQQEDYSGPWVNFATTLRLGGFRKDEMNAFVCKPLQLWGRLGNPGELVELAHAEVGSNPYLLACFGHTLFHETVTAHSNRDALAVAQDILQKRLLSTFGEAVREVFHDIPSPTLKFLFLRRCLEQERQHVSLDATSFDSEWIEKELLTAGYRSTVMLRRNLLEELRIRALTEPTDDNPEIQSIIAPVVYYVIKNSERSLERLIDKYRLEIPREADQLGLLPFSQPVRSPDVERRN